MGEKTQKERMLAGERYNFFDASLEAERKTARNLMLRYNRVETETERQEILQQMLGAAGPDTLIWPPFFCTYGRNTYLGDHVFLNFMCTIVDNNEVRIGSHVMVGPGVQILTAAHDMRAEFRNQGWEVALPITIEDNVWIGGGAIILPGVRIGRNAVIGAGAVVRCRVPANAVVAGDPARVIRKIRQ